MIGTLPKKKEPDDDKMASVADNCVLEIEISNNYCQQLMLFCHHKESFTLSLLSLG